MHAEPSLDVHSDAEVAAALADSCGPHPVVLVGIPATLGLLNDEQRVQLEFLNWILDTGQSPRSWAKLCNIGAVKEHLLPLYNLSLSSDVLRAEGIRNMEQVTPVQAVNVPGQDRLPWVSLLSHCRAWVSNPVTREAWFRSNDEHTMPFVRTMHVLQGEIERRRKVLDLLLSWPRTEAATEEELDQLGATELGEAWCGIRWLEVLHKNYEHFAWLLERQQAGDVHVLFAHVIQWADGWLSSPHSEVADSQRLQASLFMFAARTRAFG